MTRSCVLALPLLLLLASCGESSEMKDAVRERLKDPGSAQFKDTVVSSDEKRACVVWNAKNSMGGYGDWHVAELTKTFGKWSISKMEGKEDNCTEVGFKAMDANLKAQMDAEKAALEKLSRAKGISSDEAYKLSRDNRACRELVESYASYSGLAAESRVRNDEIGLIVADKRLKGQLVHLESGDCEGYKRF